MRQIAAKLAFMLLKPKIREFPYYFNYVTNVNYNMLHMETIYLLHL